MSQHRELQHQLSVVQRMLIAQYHRLAAVLNATPAPTGMHEAAAKLAFENVDRAVRVLDAVLAEHQKGSSGLHVEAGLEKPATFFETVNEWLDRSGPMPTQQQILELTEAYDRLLQAARAGA